MTEIKGFETFVSPKYQNIIDEHGIPMALIIETPDSWSWAPGSAEMGMSATDFIFSLPNKRYYFKRLGGYGTDYHYFGVWEKEDYDKSSEISKSSPITALETKKDRS